MSVAVFVCVFRELYAGLNQNITLSSIKNYSVQIYIVVWNCSAVALFLLTSLFMKHDLVLNGDPVCISSKQQRKLTFNMPCTSFQGHVFIS